MNMINRRFGHISDATAISDDPFYKVYILMYQLIPRRTYNAPRHHDEVFAVSIITKEAILWNLRFLGKIFGKNPALTKFSRVFTKLSSVRVLAFTIEWSY